MTLRQKSGAKEMIYTIYNDHTNPTRVFQNDCHVYKPRLNGPNKFCFVLFFLLLLACSCSLLFVLVCNDSTSEQTIGATKLGQQYLLTKALLQSSAALNLSMYLLLKLHYTSSSTTNDRMVDDSADLIQSHPVMLRLQKINTIMQDLETNVEDKVDGLKQQVGNIVKAAALLESNEIFVSEEDEEDNEDVNDNEDSIDDNGKQQIHDDDESIEDEASDSDHDDDSKDDDDDYDDVVDVDFDEKEHRRNALIEARYGLRPNEISDTRKNNKLLRKKKTHSLLFDAGGDDDDDDDDEMERLRRRKDSMKALASTVNTIEQRAQSRIRRSAPIPEQLDEHAEDDGELKRGLEMMEAELAGKISDEDEGEMDDDDGEDNDEDGDENDFYKTISTKSKNRKEERKERYKVQPKFPSIEPDVVGERAITRQILKNRGLVAHKNKLNRNPRVKKREQYRKALIRRRGAVRDVRDKSIEGHHYGGEATGIKTHISRSRKLDR